MSKPMKLWDRCPIHGNMPRPSMCAECQRLWGEAPAKIPAPDWRDYGRFARVEVDRGPRRREVQFVELPVAPPSHSEELGSVPSPEPSVSGATGPLTKRGVA